MIIEFIFKGFKEKETNSLLEESKKIKTSNDPNRLYLTSFKYIFNLNPILDDVANTKTISSFTKSFNLNSKYCLADKTFSDYKEATDEKYRIDCFFSKSEEYINDYIDTIFSQINTVSRCSVDFYFECSEFLFNYINSIRRDFADGKPEQSFNNVIKNIQNKYKGRHEIEFKFDIKTKYWELFKTNPQWQSWSIIKSNIFNKMSKLIIKDINNCSQLESCVAKENTVLCLDYIGQTYKCLSRIETNVYSFINSSNKLIQCINSINDKTKENEIMFNSGLFSSLLFELIKSCNYQSISKNIQKNDDTIGTNLYYLVKDIKNLINRYLKFTNLQDNTKRYINIIYSTSWEYDKLAGKKLNIYNITLSKIACILNKDLHEIIPNNDPLNNETFLNNYVWHIIRNCRNPMFHSGLASLIKQKDDTNNYLYGYISNNDINDPNIKNELLEHILGITDFVINSFLYCWNIVWILLNKKSILSTDEKRKEIESWKKQNRFC